MVDAPALTRLVGEVAGFLDVSWGRSPLHVPSAARPAGGTLLTLDDVDHLVASSGLRAPAFRLVKQGRTLPQASVTRRVRIGSRPVNDLVDVAAVHDAVADGATLVLQGLHRSFAPVADFCRDLERTLTHPVQANAYLTPPVAQGLNLHEDPHDVFAVQTYGIKRWVVHTTGDDQPWDLQLEPGDVLYLPSGTCHAAQTVGEPSLHLTLGVRTITWRRVVQRALDDVLAEDPALDRPLPASWAEHPEVLEAQLVERLSAVTSRLDGEADAAGLLDREARAFWSSRSPDRGGGLRDLLELGDLDDDTGLRRRDGVTARIVTVGPVEEVGHADGGQPDGRVEVVMADRILRMPAAVEPALRRIIEGRTLRPADLDDHLDADSRIVLCRRLVREGLLTVVRDAGDGAAGG